jgi:hypothetical protein
MGLEVVTFLRLMFKKIIPRSYGYFLKFNFNFLETLLFQLSQKQHSFVKKIIRNLWVNLN